MLSAAPAPPCWCPPDWTGRPSSNLATIPRWGLREEGSGRLTCRKRTSSQFKLVQALLHRALRNFYRYLTFPESKCCRYSAQLRLAGLRDGMLWNRAMGKIFLSSLIKNSIWQWWEAPCSSAQISPRSYLSLPGCFVLVPG